MEQSLVRKFARTIRGYDFVVPTWIEGILLPESQGVSSRIDLPLVAILGPPRVGSTLMYQILVSNTQCYFFDNLQHALLRYPYLGFLLSRNLFSKSDGGLKSDHGFVNGFGGISEGNFFWPYWFDMELEQTSPQADSKRLRYVQRVLDSIYAQTELPMVSSYNAHAFYLSELATYFPKLLIVNLRREPVANAVSLLRGRRELRGDIDTWWSVRPAACVESQYSDPFAQIRCQIVEIYRSVRKQRQLIPDVPIVDVNYTDLCQDPHGVLDQILTKCGAAGIDLSLRPDAPGIPELIESGPRPNEMSAVEKFRDLFETVDWDELWS